MKRIVQTIVEKAIETVDGFVKVYMTMQQQVLLRGQSKSTLQNYIRCIDLISLHYGRLSQEISECRFAEQYIEQYQPNSFIIRTLDALQKCRTSALGGHIEECDCCGHQRISYNSCRNRHCPKCQAL